MGFKNFLSSLINKPDKSTQKRGLKGSLFTWINQLEKYNEPLKEISALNFGLFESDKGIMIYLTGSKIYDPSNDDWATEIDYEPSANNKYLLLTGEEISDLKWDESLNMVHKTLKELIDEHPEYNLFANKIITIGFDDGDLAVLKS